MISSGPISCKICKKQYHSLMSHLTRTHKISCEEYKIRYGSDSPLYSLECKNKQKKNAISPFSEKKYYDLGFSKSETKKKLKSIKQKHCKDMISYRSIQKGYSEVRDRERERILQNLGTYMNVKELDYSNDKEKVKKKLLSGIESYLNNIN